MHPIQFVKNHPVGFTVSALTGMVIGPWALSFLNRTTGVNINVPSYAVKRG
jgi:hypothetical protein